MIDEIKDNEIIYCGDKIQDGKKRKMYKNIKKENANMMAETFHFYSIDNKTYDTLVFFQTKDINNEICLEKLTWASRDKKDIKNKNFEVFYTSTAFRNFSFFKMYLAKNPHEKDPVYELI